MPRPKGPPQRSVTIRFDPSVYEQASEYAAQTRRSTNAAINELLVSALRAARRRGEYTPGQRESDDSPAE